MKQPLSLTINYADVKNQYAAALESWQGMLDMLDQGVEITQDDVTRIEDDLLEAEEKLFEYVKPYLIAGGVSPDSLDKLFLHKTDQACALAMRLEI